MPSYFTFIYFVYLAAIYRNAFTNGFTQKPQLVIQDKLPDAVESKTMSASSFTTSSLTHMCKTFYQCIGITKTICII